MNELNYEQRLSGWSAFRETLELSDDPLQDVINYYNKIPTVSIQTDPYTPSTWPGPTPKNNHIKDITYAKDLSFVLLG